MFFSTLFGCLAQRPASNKASLICIWCEIIIKIFKFFVLGLNQVPKCDQFMLYPCGCQTCDRDFNFNLDMEGQYYILWLIHRGNALNLIFYSIKLSLNLFVFFYCTIHNRNFLTCFLASQTPTKNFVSYKHTHRARMTPTWTWPIAEKTETITWFNSNIFCYLLLHAQNFQTVRPRWYAIHWTFHFLALWIWMTA